MPRGLILAPNGCEDTEIVATRDVLLRTGKIQIDIASLTDEKEFKTSHGLVIKTEKTIDEVDEKDYDFIFLPGGKLGVDNILASEKALALIKAFRKADKVLAAICAAPSILGKLGLLEGVTYTCFPGFETEGGIKADAPAVADHKIVTGRSMYYSADFGELLVQELLGQEAADALYRPIRGLR